MHKCERRTIISFIDVYVQTPGLLHIYGGDAQKRQQVADRTQRDKHEKSGS